MHKGKKLIWRQTKKFCLNRLKKTKIIGNESFQESELRDNYSKILMRIDELKRISEYDSDKTNPILNLGKPVIENIKRLDGKIPNSNRFIFFLNLILFTPQQLANIIKQILHHLKYTRREQKLHSIHDRTDCMFLSHFTGQSDLGPGKDVFYGTVPFRQQNSREKNVVIYIDHSVQKKNKRNDITVLSKTCEINIRIKLLIAALRKAFKYFRKAIDTSRQSIELANKYLYLGRIQTSLTSITSQILEHNLDKQINRLKPNKIVVTLEGHPFELALANYLSEFHKNIKIIFWQIAPVVPNQHGFIENILQFPSSINVGVTGLGVQHYIENEIKIERKIIVLGSPKFYRNEDLNKNEEECILLAPEGTREATTEFIEIIYRLCIEFRRRKIILRLHPGMENRKVLPRWSKLHNLRNFELSKETLFTDLSRSEYCVFRSSSVGVESLNFGVQPIHLSFFTKSEINPLAILNIDLLEAHNADEVVKIIQQKNKASLESLRKSYKLYYEPFNERKFLSI